ncbi:MAG: hypothetical protein EXR43_00325 [Dehalococcoidia bacterium]|nr:hypothetical protein [Dehalococcoidia bacterium]
MLKSPLRPLSRRPLLAAALLLALIVASAGVGFLRRGESAPSIRAATVPQLIYAAFQEDADILHLAPLDAPGRSSVFATIKHAQGWGIIGALSPDGRWLAYAVLPVGARNPQKEAEAHLLSLTGDGDRRVAQGVDLQVAPVWSADSARVAFGQGVAPEGASGTFTVLIARTEGGDARAFGAVTAALAARPVAFSRAGDAIYLAVTTAEGTRLDALTALGQSTIAPLSTNIARDFALSPDGLRLAYVEVPPGALPQVRVLSLTGDLRASEAVAASSAPVGPTLGPAWTPQGQLTFSVGVPGGQTLALRSGDLRAAAADSLASAPANGFDIPLAWSPDGTGLAARAITGDLGAVQGARLAILARGNTRLVFGNADSKFLGWVPAGVGG